MTTKTNITALIRAMVRKWGERPYDINNGGCEDFAMELIDRLGGYVTDAEGRPTDNGPYELDTNNFCEWLPNHVWVFYEGKHYDAECPQGVDSWKDLPLFARLKNHPHYADDLAKAPELNSR